MTGAANAATANAPATSFFVNRMYNPPALFS
jgi:hypothetical protein